MINQNWIFLGLVLQAYGAFVYLIDTVKGKVQPNRVTWLLWAIAPLIAFFAMIKQGVGIEALATFIIGFMPLLVFCASFINKKSVWQITKFDIICGTLSILGLILWLITKIGNIAILFSITADALAALLTIVKSYKNPESENYLAYLFGAINTGIALLVIKDWNFQNWGFPVYWLITSLLLTILVKFKLGKILSNYFKSL
jgi:hypothetical protein